jgi:hypothetical protein
MATSFGSNSLALVTAHHVIMGIFMTKQFVAAHGGSAETPDDERRAPYLDGIGPARARAGPAPHPNSRGLQPDKPSAARRALECCASKAVAGGNASSIVTEARSSASVPSL